ncbi:hypothetical protein EDC05_006487 [Coemansia umbellata]|uniref:Probable DNA polymerase n=1 Tax=Coemansia umbellata TaxID=1424467 RepID=A0ABQ8PCL9_9FUNG|nr:hypothetical protein EDC05_006487 [Coemansia umbellata]
MHRASTVRNASGIVITDYMSDSEMGLDKFCDVVKEYIRETNRITGLSVININLSFIDQDSRLHYYSISDLSKLEKVIIDGDLDAVFGGSDDVPEDFMIVLSTRRFRINAIDNSGGNLYHLSDYYDCTDVGGEEDNCLIECFKYFAKSDEASDDIRKKLEFKDRGLLGNKHVPTLEKYFNINVCIKMDEFNIEDGKWTPRISYGDPRNSYWILIKDNHYSIIIKERPFDIARMTKTSSSLEIENNQNKNLYYFFDYETVWDPDSYKLQPYSFAMIKTDIRGDILNTWFETMNNAEKIIDILRSEHVCERQARKILIGYNNSRFDNFMLLDLMVKNNHKDVDKIFFANNTILSMEIYGFQVMDSCRILNMPLAKACKAFRCRQQKLSLDHSVVQSMFIKGELESYLRDNYEKIKEYNIMDVRTLAELYFKTRWELKRLCRVKIENHKTLAGLSYSIFKNLNKKKKIPSHKDMERNTIRDAVVGGRAQIFQVGEFNSEPLCCIDCVSLYPYVMLNNVFPIDESKATEDYKENKMGVYKVEIENQPTISIIPFREKSQKLDWKQRKITTSVTSQDLDTLIKHKCNVKVTHGFYWEEDIGQLFRSYFKPLVEEKKKQDRLKDRRSKYPKIFGEDFGQFKEEILDLVKDDEEGPFGIFIAPKCYCFYATNKNTRQERFIKARFKGVNTERDRIWDENLNYKTLTASEIHELYHRGPLNKIDTNFYRRCLREDVTILHSNLGKTVMNKNEYLNIKQHFCLKIIKKNN